jgi:hypothetical protein
MPYSISPFLDHRKTSFTNIFGAADSLFILVNQYSGAPEWLSFRFGH